MTAHEESILVDIGHIIESYSTVPDTDDTALFTSCTELGGR